MASITCGKCKGTHQTVVQVKRCHGASYRGFDMTLVDYLTATPVFCVDCGIRNTSHQNAAGTVGPSSEHQLHPEACAKVQEELELAPAMPFANVAPVGTWAAWVQMYRDHQTQQVPGLPGVTVAAAATLATPSQPRTPEYSDLRQSRAALRTALQNLVEVPQDKLRVAVTLPGETKVRFFRIDMPLRGKWAGAVFLKEQAGDDLFRVNGVGRETAILNAVLAHPADALRRYGLELGSCGVCGRTLTDENSRALGIGPVCADKMMGAA